MRNKLEAFKDWAHIGAIFAALLSVVGAILLWAALPTLAIVVIAYAALHWAGVL